MFERSKEKVLARVYRNMSIDALPDENKYRGPLLRLALDMIDQAIEDGYTRAHQLDARPHRAKVYKITPDCTKCVAREWISGVDHGGVMFEDVCELVGFNPRAVRDALARGEARKRQRVGVVSVTSG